MKSLLSVPPLCKEVKSSSEESGGFAQRFGMSFPVDMSLPLFILASAEGEPILVVCFEF